MFKYHTSCSNCGSRDACAVYSGGSSYCFSCGYSSRSNKSPYVIEEEHATNTQLPDLSLPDDASTDYSQVCLSWVNKYGLSTEELIKNNVLWSEQKQQLIFTFKDEQGQLLLWQARNFWSEAKTKYFTRGTPDEIIAGFSLGKGRQLVLVEDCVSAIKVARQASAMPVLGSDLSKDKLTRLGRFWGPSSPILVWLDGNMFHKAQRIASRLSMLGCTAKAIYTELDPKEYPDEFITSCLSSHGVELCPL